MGERYYTYRLMANQRVDGKLCQMTLLGSVANFVSLLDNYQF